MADQPDIIEAEIWKDIPEWDGYQASSLGRIRSLDRIRVQRMRDGSMQPVLYPGKIRSQSQCPQTRYMKVGLTQPGKRKRTWCVNVLVCMAFHGLKPPKHEAAHENGDRADNRPENLEWKTRKANLADRYRHGTINHGERNGQAKLTEATVKAIKKRCAQGVMQKDVAIEYGVCPRTVSDIATRKRWAYLE